MLIDSTAFVDLIRSYPPAINAFGSLLRGQSASIASKLELITGCRTKKDAKGIDKMFNDFEIKLIPFDEDVCVISEKILKKYHHSNGIGILDSLIAATALAYDEELVTQNVKHFNFIPKLKIFKAY